MLRQSFDDQSFLITAPSKGPLHHSPSGCVQTVTCQPLNDALKNRAADIRDPTSDHPCTDEAQAVPPEVKPTPYTALKPLIVNNPFWVDKFPVPLEPCTLKKELLYVNTSLCCECEDLCSGPYVCMYVHL